MIVVQTFNRAGWPPNSTIELDDHAAAALLTAVRDYEAERHTSLHGDYVAAPVGGTRTMAEVLEMRAAWRAPRNSTLWQTIGRDKYNMDPASKAIPSLTSPHLYGLCMDISDNNFLAWLVANGTRYGLRRTLVAEHDLRHFQYFPGTATAALDVTSLNNTPQQEEPPMTNDTRVFQMIDANGADIADWSRIGPDVLPIGTFPGGYEATADHATAVLWVAQYGLDAAGPIKRQRDQYVAQQQFGAKEYATHQAALAKLIKDSTNGTAGPGFDYAAMAKAVNDDAAKRLAQ